MIPTRRAFVASAAMAPFFAPSLAHADARAVFGLRRGDSDIGTHRISTRPVPGGLDVDVDIDITVRVLGLAVYSYRLTAREQWRDGALEALDSSGSDNGDAFSTTIRRGPEGLVVRGALSGVAPLDAVPTTYWTAEFLDRPTWIDIQSGRIMTVTARPIGDPARGTTAPAQGWFVSNGEKFNLDLWYGPEGRWVGCRFEARGAKIVYTPLSLGGAPRRIASL